LIAAIKETKKARLLSLSVSKNEKSSWMRSRRTLLWSWNFLSLNAEAAWLNEILQSAHWKPHCISRTHWLASSKEYQIASFLDTFCPSFSSMN
jgi:hypothetical protein